MPVGSLPVDAVHERLMEARRTYRLNMGCDPEISSNSVFVAVQMRGAHRDSCDCYRTTLLCFSVLCRYAGLTHLPAGFVDMVKKYNPHITELELSR